MEDEIISIIKNQRVDGVFHSHVSMIHPKGKYQFNKQQLDNFWDKYINIIYNNKNTICGMAEKPQHIMPVLVDIDLKKLEYENSEEEQLYNKENVEQIIGIYQSVLKNIIEGCNDENLLCVLLEKKPYWVKTGENNYMKNGFHLHFPNCFLNRIEQEVHLIPRVKHLLNETKMFEQLEYENSGDVIDKSCCTNAWLLYGSRKSENKDPYLISRVYDSDMNEISLDEAFSSYLIYDYKDKPINIKNNIEKYLPRILSIIPNNRDYCELKSGLSSPLKEKIKNESKQKNYSTLSVTESLRVAKKLISMIAMWRVEDHNEWMIIGWILYNVGEGSSEALEIWCDFSSQSEDKYDESVCVYQWDRMTKKDLTLGTLRYYAKTDNLDEYNKFKAEESNSHLQDSMSGSHYNIGKIMYAEYGDEFVCSSILNKKWYQFNNHHWEEIEEGIFLRKKISNEIVEKFSNEGCKMFQQLSGKHDKGSAEETLYNARLKQSHKMINNLNCNSFKNSVMKECSEIFYDHRFKDKLDTNPYLIAFKNGVFDLQLKIFRPGRPEDFISKTLPINYVNFNMGDERVSDVYKFLEQVFPDKSVRDYFMTVSSDVFVGSNFRKIGVFWTGDGDNGKTITQLFFEKMFGKLAVKFNTTLVTGQKINNGSANAELARAGGGVRWAVLEEPDNDETINNGIFKMLTGNDSYFARDLFEKGKETKEITPLFKLVFICNKLPRFKHSDKATFNRVRVIPFESTFCRPSDPAPDTYEEQLRLKRFPMDPNFSKKIPKLVEAFAWILLEHYKKNVPYIEPEKVLSATECYKKQNDVYLQFIDECISEDNNRYLSLIELYTQFKDWFKDSLPHHNLPVKNDIKEYFCKIWGEPDKGNKWKGYKIKTLSDQVDSGDVIIMDENDFVEYNTNNLPPM